jgi:ribose 5-phosphate isomerase B
MTASNRIVLSSDHAAIHLRKAIAVHIAAQGWEVTDIGPTTPQSTHYPKHSEAAARSLPPAIAGLASFYAAPARES